MFEGIDIPSASNPKPEDVQPFRWPQGSAMANEMRLWDLPKRQGGRNANGYEEYPRMLYRASQKTDANDVPSGPYMVIDARDPQWSTRNYTTVRDADEKARMMGLGWRESPEAALAYAETSLDRLAVAAAERMASERTMSARAQAEVREHEDETTDQLGEIPVKRRGRPKKSTIEAAA